MNSPESNQYVVEMKNIVKKFPGVVALDHVNLQLLPGEVHVLLGENGAGKSTLIKVLSGAYLADEGEIFINGQKVDIKKPQAAINQGLRFIYQELNLVKSSDIARNMYLGQEPMLPVPGLVDEKKLYQQAGELLKRFHIELEPHEVVNKLSVTQQKLVEIARALTTQAKVIVMDEPTDVLEDRSRNQLFDVIKQLKSEHGVSFVYISHRYREVYEIGDRVTILRDGKNEGTYQIKDLSFDTMIEHMIGDQVKKQYPNLREPTQENALQVDKLSRGRYFKNISLTVKKGEIVGITGLMGAGKTELGRAIAGIDLIDSGEIIVDGNIIRSKTPEKSIANGIAYLPEDRKSLGLIQEHTIRDNYALPSLNRLSTGGLVRHGQIDIEVKEHISSLVIKTPNIFMAARQLSGGNQQKVVVAKWLGAQAKVLIFDEPTRGIDINGRREIYRVMEELLEKGVGILMLTSDYTEALEMSHRVIVLRNGEICKDFKRGEAQETDILREAIGSVTPESVPQPGV